MNNKIFKAVAPITSVILLALLAGCASAETPSTAPAAAPIPERVSQSAPEFFGSWSLTPDGANEPALTTAPAAIAADGSVELIFMFTTDEATRPIVSSHVESSEGFVVELICQPPAKPNAQLVSCITPRFNDPMSSNEYQAVIETTAETVSGTATVNRAL
jgi:hypothetical protein